MRFWTRCTHGYPHFSRSVTRAAVEASRSELRLDTFQVPIDNIGEFIDEYVIDERVNDGPGATSTH